MASWKVSDNQGWRKGPWSPEEDKLLVQYVSQYGDGRWSCASKFAGLNRSGKSCRLRWVNYLRPGLKKGHLTPQEEGIIIELHALWGNKWSTIARYLPGRTDNEIKNYWRTRFKKLIKKPSQNPKGKRKEALVQKLQQQTRKNNESIILKASPNYQAEKSTIDEEKNCKQSEIKTEICAKIEDHDQFLPMINYHDGSTWSDFISPIDDYLWGGLWNMDEQNGCNKMAVHNQANNIVANYYDQGCIF